MNPIPVNTKGQVSMSDLTRLREDLDEADGDILAATPAGRLLLNRVIAELLN